MMENLYVFVDEYKEVKGIYEEDEIGEFFNDYLIELTTEIEEHYTIGEQLEMHLNVLGNLSKYYDTMNINFDKDIREYIALYNMIAPNRLVFEKVEDVEEDEIQDIIEYINKTKDGWEKYKNNNYQIPQQKKVKVEIHKHDSKARLRKYTSHIVDENNIESVIRKLIVFEIDDLKENYKTDEMLDLQYVYLSDLLELDKSLRHNLYPNQTLLDRFCYIFNEEHEFVSDEVKRTSIYC